MTAPLIGPEPSHLAIQRCCRIMPAAIAWSVNSLERCRRKGITKPPYNNHCSQNSPRRPLMRTWGSALINRITTQRTRSLDCRQPTLSRRSETCDDENHP